MNQSLKQVFLVDQHAFVGCQRAHLAVGEDGGGCGNDVFRNAGIAIDEHDDVVPRRVLLRDDLQRAGQRIALALDSIRSKVSVTRDRSSVDRSHMVRISRSSAPSTTETTMLAPSRAFAAAAEQRAIAGNRAHRIDHVGGDQEEGVRRRALRQEPGLAPLLPPRIDQPVEDRGAGEVQGSPAVAPGAQEPRMMIVLACALWVRNPSGIIVTRMTMTAKYPPWVSRRTIGFTSRSPDSGRRHALAVHARQVDHRPRFRRLFKRTTVSL